jgi:hypothetical protein
VGVWKDAAMDGQGVALATAVATAIATTVSLVVSLWWRWADRKEPDWMTLRSSSKFGNGGDSKFEYSRLTCSLTNVGDATAFRVRVHGHGCKAVLGVRSADAVERDEQAELITSIGPSEDSTLMVWAMPEDWDDAFIVITWLVSPTRRRSSRRSQQVPLGAIARQPSFVLVRMRRFDDSIGQYTYDETYELPEDFAVPTHLLPERPLPPGGASWWWRWRAERRARRS